MVFTAFGQKKWSRWRNNCIRNDHFGKLRIIACYSCPIQSYDYTFYFVLFIRNEEAKKVDKQQNWISVAAIFSRHNFRATTTTTPNQTTNWIITFIWFTYCGATCFPVVIEYHFIRSFRLTNKHVIYVYILHTLWYDRRLHRAVTAFFSVLRLISLPSYERQ